MPDPLPTSPTYQSLLADLKARIQAAQLRATLSVNRELVLLYWHLGREILLRQRQQGWGARVIDQLAADLRLAFPAVQGFSPRNLKYMRAFAEAWPDAAIVQHPVAQLPWGHNLRLLDLLDNPTERLWYIEEALRQGWSRNVLVLQVESRLFHRQGKALSNFERTLPNSQSDLARDLLKDPYHFDFLTLGPNARERDLEQALLLHLRQFLLELGTGFAFVGSQVPLSVGGEEFRLDLLFYHLKLRAYVVIELKMTPFEPEYAGKMNFYLAAVDDLLRHPQDEPSLGIILCRSRNRIVAEYALRNLTAPLSVAEFHLLEQLPVQLQGTLPTIAEIEAELERAQPSPELEPAR